MFLLEIFFLYILLVDSYYSRITYAPIPYVSTSYPPIILKIFLNVHQWNVNNNLVSFVYILSFFNIGRAIGGMNEGRKGRGREGGGRNDIN